jgi:hypothetical protein
MERPSHKEYTCENPITYHSKDMSNVKVFADRETNIETDRLKTIYAPNIKIQRHKNQ